MRKDRENNCSSKLQEKMFTDDKKRGKIKISLESKWFLYGLNFEKGKILFEVF